MFGLLNSVFRKRAQDPVSSLTATRRWIRSLPLRDSHRAHRMVLGALERFNARTGSWNEERLSILKRLDESGGAVQQALCLEYLSGLEAASSASCALWQEIFAFYWHLALGYQSCVGEYLSRGQGALGAELPGMTARALRYSGLQVQWRYFRREGVPPDMWQRLHRLYRLAESRGFATWQVATDSQGGSGSCAGEYLTILLMDLAAPVSLSPAQVAVLGRWLGRWAAEISIEPEVDYRRHSHYVDLSNGGAAGLTGPVAGANLRYWGMKGALEEIDGLCRRVSNGELPAGLGLGEGGGLPACLELLQHLRASWFWDGPDAVAEQGMELACGVEAILKRLRGDAGEEPLAAARVSSSGDGKLMLETFACSSAASGKLLALRGSGGEGGRWRIAVIRGISGDAPGALVMDVEQLSDVPRRVRVVAGGGRASAGPNNGEEALFLPRVDRRGIASSLILPGPLAVMGALLELLEGDSVYRIRLTAVLEKSGEWGRVKFDVLGRSARAEGHFPSP